MKRDIINYGLLVLLGIILLFSFLFNYKDFDYYFEKVISAETEEAKIEYFKEAIAAWKESDGKEKKAYAYMYVGYDYFQKERYEDSIREFNEGIKTKSDLIELYLARGTSFMRLQKLEKALADFNSALKLDSVNPHALFDMGWAYHKMKDYDKAQSYYNKAFLYSKYSSQDEVLRSKGILRLETGNPELALRCLQKSFEIKKDTYTILLSVISASELSEEAYSKEKNKLDEVAPSNHWERTLLKFYMGNITEATMFAETKKASNAKRVRERLCEAYYYAGKHAQYKGDKKKAKEYFELVLKQNLPEFIEHGLAEAELSKGK